MSEGFDVDTESLRRFAAAAQRIEDRVNDLHGLKESARLAPGTFTRTEAGQVADAGHRETVNGIGSGLDAMVEQLRAIADAATRSANNYETTDARHAAALSDIEERINTARGYQA